MTAPSSSFSASRSSRETCTEPSAHPNPVPTPDEMLAYGRERAEAAGIDNIEFVEFLFNPTGGHTLGLSLDHDRLGVDEQDAVGEAHCALLWTDL